MRFHVVNAGIFSHIPEAATAPADGVAVVLVEEAVSAAEEDSAAAVVVEEEPAADSEICC